MAITERINGNQKIATFVDVYNNNNEKLEDEIESLKKDINILKHIFNKKADKSTLNDIIYNEIIRVLDNEYNSDENPRRFVRLDEVKEIIHDILDSNK